MSQTLTLKAKAISRVKKERFLLAMPEDRFRDEVVRPLFLRMGLKDGRELCGPTEEGKDTLFVAVDQLAVQNVYVVQTKRGSLNLARQASQNVVEATTQLKTAPATTVILKAGHEKKPPTKAILCVSGKINDRAKAYISEEVRDPRVEFLDADNLIDSLDEHYPELWFGIDADISPYLRAVKKALEDSSEDAAISVGGVGPAQLAASTDAMFVQLTIHRTVMKPRRRRGKVEQVPTFEELPVTGLLNRRERLLLVLGEAGSGKTTSLRRLAYILAEKGLESEEKIRIPILLRVSDLLTRAGSSVVEICAEHTREISKSVKASFATGDLSDGRVVVLLDGLDELVSDDARRTALQALLEFNQYYPKCQIIAASRGYSFINELEELKPFKSFRLSLISYKQAQQILNRFHRSKSLPIESSKEILRRLQHIHGMELNPLLITVFAATSEHSRRDIPANITELFKKFTELMLGRWDLAKGLAHQYHAPLKDFILMRVGYEMHRRRVTSINEIEFSALVEKELRDRGHEADIGQFLDEILVRSGLFRIIGQEVEFKHLLLQEFFAGRGIPSDELLEGMVADQWWQRAIVFYFGERPGNSRGLSALQKSLASRPLGEAYVSAITLGLALQACYLVEVKDKVELFRAVIEGLTISRGKAVAVFGGGRQPLMGFLGYYLFGRDAVACNIIEQKTEEIKDNLAIDGLAQEERDIRTFWVITGLIECGALEKAEKLMKGFRPADPRLLLAVHLGCFVLQHLRVTTKDEKKLAERISNSVAERANLLRPQLLDEFKTELLEVRGGKVAAIEAGEEEEGSGEREG